MHHLWPIYQCHGQQLAFLSDFAVSSPRLFCLVIRSKCQHAYCLASYELFSSLIAQLVERHFMKCFPVLKFYPTILVYLKKC